MVTIDVTREDIDSGIPRSTCRCPIALAAKRALGRTDLEVVPYGIGLGVIWQDGFANLTREAKQFMGAFDNSIGKSTIGLQPFSFDVEFWPAAKDKAVTYDL